MLTESFDVRRPILNHDHLRSDDPLKLFDTLSQGSLCKRHRKRKLLCFLPACLHSVKFICIDAEAFVSCYYNLTFSRTLLHTEAELRHPVLYTQLLQFRLSIRIQTFFKESDHGLLSTLILFSI